MFAEIDASLEAGKWFLLTMEDIVSKNVKSNFLEHTAKLFLVNYHVSPPGIKAEIKKLWTDAGLNAHIDIQKISNSIDLDINF